MNLNLALMVCPVFKVCWGVQNVFWVAGVFSAQTHACSLLAVSLRLLSGWFSGAMAHLVYYSSWTLPVTRSHSTTMNGLRQQGTHQMNTPMTRIVTEGGT